MRYILFILTTFTLINSLEAKELYLRLKSKKPFFAKVLQYKKGKIIFESKGSRVQKKFTEFSEESQRRLKSHFTQKKTAIITDLESSKIKGEILKFDGGNFEVKTPSGIQKISRDKVDHIIFANGHRWQIKEKPHDKDYEAEVELVFYSSIEDEVYAIGDFNGWNDQATKMTKDGYRFSCSVKVKNSTRFKFVSRRSYYCHYNLDPLNPHEDGGTSSIILYSDKKTTNENPLVQFIYSKHCDLFTLNHPKQIYEIERLYKVLTTKILAFFSNQIQPSRGKIRQYSTFNHGAFAIHGSSEFVGNGEFINTHEMIHLLIGTPSYGPFAEGFAQCFQLSGNAKFLPIDQKYNFDTNPTISVKNKIKGGRDIKIKDVMANFNGYLYHEMASFVYWSTHVDKRNLKKFVAWARDLNHHHKHACDSYKKIFGYDLSVASKKWNDWVRTVKAEDCNVDWHYGRYLNRNRALPAADDPALFARGRKVTNKYLKEEKFYLTVHHAFKAHSGWGAPRTNRSVSGVL